MTIRYAHLKPGKPCYDVPDPSSHIGGISASERGICCVMDSQQPILGEGPTAIVIMQEVSLCPAKCVIERPVGAVPDRREIIFDSYHPGKRLGFSDIRRILVETSGKSRARRTANDPTSRVHGTALAKSSVIDSGLVGITEFPCNPDNNIESVGELDLDLRVPDLPTTRTLRQSPRTSRSTRCAERLCHPAQIMVSAT